MKGRFFIIAAVVFFTGVSGPGWAIENPAIRNPVGFGTLPPSNIRSGLIRSPNPIDTSGNLVITGNIRGGRHFRGIVPYRASSYFEAVTASSLDSFLRGSVGSEDSGRYTGAYKPFYSPSRTVTTTRSGQAGVFRPPTAEIGGHIGGFDAVRTLPSPSRKQVLSYPDTGILVSRFKGLRFAGFQMQGNAFWGPAESRGMRTHRPMSTTPLEMERAILTEADAQIYRDKNRILVHRERAAREETRMEQFRGELEQAQKRVSELEKSLADQDESLRLWSSKIMEKDALQPFELQRLRKQPTEDKQWSRERDMEQGTELDVYEQIEQQIDELQRSYEQLVAAESAKGSPIARGPKEAVESGGGTDAEGSGFVGPVSAKGRKVESKGSPEVKGFLMDELSRFQIGRKSGVSQGQKDVFWVPAESRTAGSEPSGMNLSARAKAILGAHRSFESFSNDKLNQHLIVGERYLKEGKYYRSADAYTLALIYKPGEPLAYAGKSHALFAAGEYVSSALFLSRAIIAESKRCKAKDCEVRQFLALIAKHLVFMDRDKLEDRLMDLEGWQQRSGSAELQFLLGYIYYQIGRLDAAVEAIDGTYEKMPEEPAVVALRKVIFDARYENRESIKGKGEKNP
jgi:tetratricopeptide (TPR) repeat protein